MTALMWFVGIFILTGLTVVACALAIGSDADDIADATLDTLNDCQDG